MLIYSNLNGVIVRNKLNTTLYYLANTINENPPNNLTVK